MFPAARVTDNIVSTATPSCRSRLIPPGTPTVLIGSLPAATLGDSCGAVHDQRLGDGADRRQTRGARHDTTAGGGIVMPR